MKSLELVRPTFRVESFAELPMRELAEGLGIKKLSLDIDESVASHSADTLPTAHLEKLQEAAEYGLSGFFSTNLTDEVRMERADVFTAQIHAETDFVMGPTIASLAVGHRKPHRSMFEAGVDSAGVEPQYICHVDDLLWRGVFGANRAGYGATVWCGPYGEGSNMFVEGVERPLEEILYRLAGGALYKAGESVRPKVSPEDETVPLKALGETAS